MAELIDFQEHKLLELIARRQGLTYNQYRKLLRQRNISLENAIKKAQTNLVLYLTSKEENYEARIDILYSRVNDQERLIEFTYEKIYNLEEESKEKEALKDRRTQRGINYLIGSMVAASFIGLFASFFYNAQSTYQQTINNKEQIDATAINSNNRVEDSLTDFYEKYG